MHLQNEKGLTLLEVLLSIVILTIILTTVMNFFPQMGFMNNKNEEKQQAVNLAKMELVEWQEDSLIVKDFLLNGTPIPDFTQQPDKTVNGERFFVFKNTTKYPSFTIEVDLKEKSDLTTEPNKAHLIYIKVFNNNNKVSETYGYIIY